MEKDEWKNLGFGGKREDPSQDSPTQSKADS
jgi:hypothetical protein